jgi:TatD DNase family protein
VAALTSTMLTFYDTHAHLDYPDFGADFAQILERAQAAGITRLLSIGTDLESSQRAIQLAEANDCIYAVAGCHPNEATHAPEDIRPALRDFAKHPKVIALGETGLDYYRLPSTKGGTPAEDEAIKHKQAAIFRQHLEIAADTGLNCVIHQRGDCFADTLGILQPFAGCVRGQFHCFAGTVADMQRVLALNSVVSFTGIATFRNGQNVRDVIAATPLGKFMLETDCPFLAPMPYRGKRCEPAYVKEISEIVAQVKGCSLEELSHATCTTAHEFFPRLKAPTHTCPA